MHMYFSFSSSFSSLHPPTPSPSIRPPAAPKCIYEHLLSFSAPLFRSPDGGLQQNKGVYVDKTMLLILLVIVLIILILLAYFGRGFVIEKKISQPVTNLLLSTEVKNDITDSQDVSEQCNEHVTTTEETPIADQDDTPRIENIVNSEALIQKAEEPERNLRMVPEALENSASEYSKIPGELRVDTETKHPTSSQKTPEGSPKSTSSCISSDILTDSILDDREVLSSIEQFGRGERASSISRPSSFPIFSTSSSSAPYFNFTRKTPEFIPRMMLEEFELLDRSIEKRKMNIRDLLKRIQSAKRRHRRFSEHIQRVQREHHINY